MSNTNYPVHQKITVHSGETIYRNDDWWKAAVIHSFGDADPEIGIYLWHRDDGWTRKNKYHVKTAEAWETDKELVERYLEERGDSIDDQSAFPVSDYYRITHGESVFKGDDWWKAIVSIDQKGSYETQESIIYLWQQIDGDWRRRQKYTIKNRDAWDEDREAVDRALDEGLEANADSNHESTSDAVNEGIDTTSSPDEAPDDILSDVRAEVQDLHLGTGVDEED